MKNYFGQYFTSTPFDELELTPWMNCVPLFALYTLQKKVKKVKNMGLQEKQRG